MKSLYLLKNEVQNYAWGSHTFLQNLFDIEDEKPMAELWIGAHPKAPSYVPDEAASLLELIKKEPLQILGKKTSEKFGQLPFLFKILCAEKALSIQAHPNLQQAKKGYKEEKRASISLTASYRNYKDKNHKPELICALTPFTALCGFRTHDEIVDRLSYLHLPKFYKPFFKYCQNPTSKSLKKMFLSLLQIEDEQKESLTVHLLRKLSEQKPRNENEKFIYEWIFKLENQYPNDPGIFAPLLLNLVQLKPMEALALEAGVMHAYLAGNGIEIMASSDNVLRGGLTQKHIDIKELSKVVHFIPYELNRIVPKERKDGMEVYQTNFNEFELHHKQIKDDKIVLKTNDKVTIILAIDGHLKIISKKENLTIGKGQTALITANAKQYSIQGTGNIFLATIGK